MDLFPDTLPPPPEKSSGKVVHCKIEPFDVYIGRPSEWGNPFVVGKDGEHAEVVDKYRAWARTQPALLAKVAVLHGQTLGCWCKTKFRPNRPCHGDVLVELAAEAVAARKVA